MLTIFRRHMKDCKWKSRKHRNCQCPIAVEGTLNGKVIRKRLSMKPEEAWMQAGFESAKSSCRISGPRSLAKRNVCIEPLRGTGQVREKRFQAGMGCISESQQTG
jgi:hypothetical protein